MRVPALEALLVSYARHFPIRRGKLRLVNALWPLGVGGGNTRRLAELKYGGLKAPCDLNELLQRQLYFFGTYFIEEHIIRCWQDAVRDANVIFDVGANAGIYSLSALAVQPHIAVHAFEPTPEIAARLRQTAALNGLQQLEVHQIAVYRRNGYVMLNRYRGALGDNEGMNYVTEASTLVGSERVQAVCLDGFCRERGIDRIDVLKLDIQGQEHSALVGAGDLLESGRVGTIFMELNWGQNQAGACPATDSIRLLQCAGYVFAAPNLPFNWREAGDWVRPLSDIVARQSRPEVPKVLFG
jgi:FkbM family methyltransferase